MTRWTAAATHLAISACFGAAAAIVIYGVWYPPPYSHATGGDQLTKLLLGVDVVLGPLLTLVVYKAGKKSLRFDLSVIALVQACAFIYGVSVVTRARPAFIVGRVDRFVLVAANDLDGADLAKAQDPKFRHIPWTGPVVVGALLPAEAGARNDLLFSSVGGKDLEQFPAYYVDYEQAAPQLLAKARPLEKLVEANAKARDVLDAYFAQHPAIQRAEVVWLPLTGRRADMTMLLDRVTGKPLQALAIDPW